MIRALKGFIMNRIKFIVKILALAVIILCCLSTGASAKEFKGKKSDEGDKELIPEDELKDAYEALKEVIPQMDYDAVETILEDVSRYSLPEKEREILDEIRKYLKLFDWEKLEEIINEI